jgi:predicted kinase
MPKLKMLKGLPASGKSTYAREQVKSDGNVGRINRDDLRAMLFDSVWTGKREGLIVDCEKAIAEVLFKHKHVALIDDTNLTQKHHDLWGGFAREKGVAFEAVDLNQPLAICVQRDRNREKRVGLAVLHRMALFAGVIEWGDKPIVLCDIDGTVACGLHREHHLEGPKKDWKAYYSELQWDRPIEFVIRWLKEWAKTHTVCMVSGRPDTYQFETVRWLEEHEIPFDYLFMRPGGDNRPDTEIKLRVLSYMPKERIEAVLDDRPSVVRAWRSEGLKVYPVRGACEEF